MNYAMLQARVISQPLKSKNVGWWTEFHFFYVKFTDFEARDNLKAMVLTNGALTSMKSGSADLEYFHAPGGVQWAELATKRVVEEYFRDQGEAANAYMIGNYYAAQIGHKSWLDSLVDDTAAPPAANDLQDDPDLTILSSYQDQYDRMRQMRMTDLNYEDWLREQGVGGVTTAENESLYRPEWLRTIKKWSMPTNIVEPSTGVPTSAFVESVVDAVRKPRFFKEPGFILGLSVTKPKVYLTGVVGSAAGFMDEARLWFPQSYADEGYTSIREFPDPTGSSQPGPLQSATNGYWADMRDLLIYGEQWRNFDIATADNANGVPLPTAALVHRYADATAADDMFSGGANNRYIDVEGVCTLNIKSAQIQGDMT